MEKENIIRLRKEALIQNDKNKKEWQELKEEFDKMISIKK